ncbi:somatostatin 1, tandem duplicate 1 [Eucyclogobius newberryi]|uniref:somatostatin 1, tandem duplicate 1 n=1 Tax=Eucyclogobius newberryi TaxID=166745 RepID=UPI003B59D964
MSPRPGPRPGSRPGPAAQTGTRVLVALLMLALCVCARPDSDKVHALLRSVSLAPDKHQQELSLLSSLLLSELLSLENDSLQDPDPEGVHVDPEGVHVDPEGVHVDPAGVHVQRNALLLAPRERKAGCKNFFWKTFTSC